MKIQAMMYLIIGACQVYLQTRCEACQEIEGGVHDCHWPPYPDFEAVMGQLEGYEPTDHAVASLIRGVRRACGGELLGGAAPGVSQLIADVREKIKNGESVLPEYDHLFDNVEECSKMVNLTDLIDF